MLRELDDGFVNRNQRRFEVGARVGIQPTDHASSTPEKHQDGTQSTTSQPGNVEAKLHKIWYLVLDTLNTIAYTKYQQPYEGK